MLSDLGHQMAQRVGETLKDRDIVEVWASLLERAQQTATPLAELKGPTSSPMTGLSRPTTSLRASECRLVTEAANRRPGATSTTLHSVGASHTKRLLHA